MAYIEDGGPAGRAGIFYRVAFYVEELQFALQDLNRRLPNHWPFLSIKAILGDVGHRPTHVNKWLAWLVSVLWKADTWAKPLVDDIADRLKTGDLDGLIEDYAPGVWSFFQDPEGAIMLHLYSFSTDVYWFLQDISDGFGAYLKTNFYQLWALQDHPKNYILGYMWGIHEELYWFALGPLAWLDSYIIDVTTEVRWFIRDPYHFVHWYLLKMDSPLAPFWADPGNWVIDHIIDWIVEAIIRDWETA